MGDEVENLDVRSVSGKVIFKTPEGVNLYSVGHQGSSQNVNSQNVHS